MSKVSITRSLLDDLAMSISAKSGEAVPMTLAEMKDAVDSIQTGGGGSVTQDQDGYIVLPSTGGGGGGGATQHTIHLEFSDSSDTDIDVYYDDSLIGTMITTYEPATWAYSSKTVTLAQLDNVTWYDKQSIPLNTELIDFTKVVTGYVADESTGEEVVSQWSCCSDYTLIDPSMTFSYVGYQWYAICFYTANKTFISAIDIYQDSGVTIVNDYGHGTLTPSKIPNTATYVRISSYPTQVTSTELSLIRTA